MTSVSRLNNFYQPEHYDLLLTLDEHEHRFEGTVTITGDKLSDDQPIKLHAKDLTITAASIDSAPATYRAGEHDELILEAGDVAAGQHLISVSFSGIITDHMHGLYPCYYDQEGAKKELFATQFESHHAREVFPCVDEPAAKATFSLRLTTADGQTVLSNMPIKEQAVNEGRLVTSFETTPRMSTYLLAFVVGDMQKKTATTKNGIEVNVWSTPSQPIDSLDFPLDVAVRALDFFEEYFDTPYPLPKCDHVALPDFSSGAMENWGLITYREIALLADPKTTGISSKQYIARVIAHELSHQWFGNLVTMEWWNDLWLNESFAELMMYLAVDELEPEWNTWLDFNADITIAALRRDAIDGVQAVQVEVNHPDEISTLFDGAIVYAKGGRLIRMIRHYIGDEAFRTGLKRYFADYAYRNTVGNDLWEALGDASGKKVATIMNTWISQPGYPVVTVTRDDKNLTLEQEQFFIGPHEPSTRQWPIPLDANDGSAPELLNDKKISYSSTRPLQLNKEDAAHFITHYDDLSRSELIRKIASGELDAIGRIQLLNEATLLVRGGIMTSDQLIPLISAYKDEKLEQVWGIISLAVAELRKFVEDNEQAEKKLRHFSAQLAKKEYTRLGWHAKEGEPQEDTKLRSIALGMTLYGEDPEAIQSAKEIYQSNELDALDPELRPLILSSVSRYGDGSVVDELMQKYRSTHSSEIQNDICAGVTSTRVPEKIDELLDTIKNPDVVRPQDVFRWFVYLVRGKDSREQAWKWVRDNWEWVDKTFSGDKSYDDFPRYSANGLVTRTQLEEYKEFFEPKKDIPALSRVISMGISEIEGRVELIERDKDAVISALLSLKDN